jgi:hypothetical protein
VATFEGEHVKLLRDSPSRVLRKTDVEDLMILDFFSFGGKINSWNILKYAEFNEEFAHYASD